MEKQQIRRKQIMSVFSSITAGLFLLCSLFLNGCTKQQQEVPVTSGLKTKNSQGQTTDESGTASEPAKMQPEKYGYVFCYHNIEIAVDMPAAPILEALGKEQSVFEAESCVTGDIIRTYSYGSFELDTYEQEGEEYISCICFRDDTVMTKEGIRLFMTMEQMISVYGTEYEEKAGTILYSQEQMKLKFILKDTEIISIQYCSMATEAAP